MLNRCSKWIKFIKKGSLFLGCVLLISALFIGCLLYQLPDIKGLPSTKWPLPIYIYTREGECIAEFGPRRHQTVQIEDVPPLLQKAFFAIEDKRFLEHKGVDTHGLLRAALELLTTGRKSQGGSTITMQVARNYYLTREKSFLRKIREIFLALKIERTFTKEQILTFYLNKIYMGYRNFGVGAAAEFYCQKPLDQLSLAEMALLAGIPQAPALLNPIKNSEACKKRRDLVLYRLYCLGFIKTEDYTQALSEAIVVPKYDTNPSYLYAPYVADMAQDALRKMLKEEDIEAGLHVYTTIESRTQRLSDEAIVAGLCEYDQRHGYRGPEKRIPRFKTSALKKLLSLLNKFSTIHGLQPAVVMTYDARCMTAMLSKGEVVTVSRAGWAWMLESRKNTSQPLFKPGDIVRLYQQEGIWCIGQIPKVQGALVALDPKSGAIKALSGGFSYKLSQFNRATHAMRQTGSSFKPFVYAAAFEKGYNLSDVFNDAPLVFDIPDRMTHWRPQNATQSFSGLTRLRVALVVSINLVTIRLLQAIGIPYALQVIKRFGFDTKKWPNNLSLALGSVEATPLEMARAYAAFANGGYRVTPYVIDHITDYQGHLLYQAKPSQVPSLEHNTSKSHASFSSSTLQNIAPQVISNEVAFLVNSALKGVIPYSGDHIAQYLARKDLAGKTGTTNDSMDNWFIGYNKRYVASVWMGLDQRQPLYEYAHTTALPLWVRLMKPLLQGVPDETLKKPSGIVILPMDPETGLPTQKSSSDTLHEYFQATSLERYKASMMPPGKPMQTNEPSEVPLF